MTEPTPVPDYGRTQIDDKAKAAGSKGFRVVRNILAIVGLVAVAAAVLLAVGLYHLAT